MKIFLSIKTLVGNYEGLLYNENHAIVAWFKRALAMKKPPIVIE